ncbi:hypothetical protein [Gemella cuniculi]|uniref:hypothetical protein n=1 Tax=Gemella cuniculi TaxID=150240 RepID=UPI0003FEE82C|nr:hypothetical protein [Gemella cuniculi]
MPPHNETYTPPTKRLEKENGRHQVLTNPVYIDQNKVTGHTSVRGSVMMSVNGAFMTVESKIDENGYFETKLQDVAEGLKFKKGDIVNLSFISEDGDLVIKNIPIREFSTEGKKTESPFTPNTIKSSSPTLSGKTENDSQIHLYDAETGKFIAEAISDENGDYSVSLTNVKPGQKFYRVHISSNNQYNHLTLDTVDGKSETLSNSLIPYVLDKLNIFAEEEESSISHKNPLFVRKLHTETNHFIGRSIFPNTYIKITSSIQGKQYPPLVADELGYFGVDMRDIERKFEKGEKITFQVIDPKTMAELTSKTYTIINREEEAPLEERTFTTDMVTTDHGYLKGKTAPNLEIQVYKNGKSDNIIAKATSDNKGNVEIDLLNHQLKENDTLSIVGYDLENGRQIFWKHIPVMKGSGIRITKPKNTDEIKTPKPSDKNESHSSKKEESSKNNPVMDNKKQNIIPKLPESPVNKTNSQDDKLNNLQKQLVNYQNIEVSKKNALPATGTTTNNLNNLGILATFASILLLMRKNKIN